MATTSRGTFRPTNIKDDFGKNSDKAAETQIAFDFKGTHYAARLKKEDDQPDGNFMKLLESALAENKVDGRWYNCKGQSQESGYIFLTAKQYAFLKEKQPALFPDH